MATTRLRCPACGAPATFTSSWCATCGRALGWLSPERRLVALVPDGSEYTIEGGAGERWWRCLNLTWGCNWLLPAGAEHGFCESCALTGVRPLPDSVGGVRAWAVAEAAKRRLVDQLRGLGLPLHPRSRDHDGVVFDFLDQCGAGCTGYHDGSIAIDLRESDDAYRAARQAEFGEPLRTVLGHLSHELGHHLRGALVVRTGAEEACRALFGDERVPYADAIAAHHGGPTDLARPGFVTPYAAAHPLEDWAECVAHYLHLRDGLDQLGSSPSDSPFADLLACWRDAVAVADAVAEGLGLAPPYTIDVDPGVEAKLAFVHDRFVEAAAARRGGT